MRQEKRVLENFEDNEEPVENKSEGANIAGPVSAWIMLLFIALVIKSAVSADTISGANAISINNWLSTIANLILGTPGEVLLPLVIGAAIGADVGGKAESLANAQKSGLLNGLYASVVYVIGIIVIYEVLLNIAPGAAPTSGDLIARWIALPIVICIIFAETFAILSRPRKAKS